MIAAVSLMPFPVPDGEAELNAENNYMWQDAVKAAKEHRAHIMTAVLGKEESLLERGKLYVKLLAACCRQKYVTGIYTSGVVFEPRFYEGFADMMLSLIHIFVNLPPRKMMGIDSEGMLISAVHEEDGREGLNLLMVDDRIPAGAKLY